MSDISTDALIEEYCKNTGMSRKEAIEEILKAVAKENPSALSSAGDYDYSLDDDLDRELKKQTLWHLRASKAEYDRHYYGQLIAYLAIVALLVVFFAAYIPFVQTGVWPEWTALFFEEW